MVLANWHTVELANCCTGKWPFVNDPASICTSAICTEAGFQKSPGGVNFFQVSTWQVAKAAGNNNRSTHQGRQLRVAMSALSKGQQETVLDYSDLRLPSAVTLNSHANDVVIQQ